MKSPFPGMDPYLERRWSNVHPALLFLIQEALQPALPSGLRARTEENVLLEDEAGKPLSEYRSDVAIVEVAPDERPRSRSSAAVLAPQPVYIKFFDEPVVDRFIKIIDTHNGNRVITAIELLSPGNKSPGDLNKRYRRKLKDYANGDVSVVEIDLLRSSRGRLQFEQVDLPPERRTPYLVGLHRAWDFMRWEVYPIELRKPVPPVPIPLREKDADVILELQPLLERVYVAGGHDDINYAEPPDPPLSADDETWANELLRAAGRR
jgi:hypothetical protein